MGLPVVELTLGPWILVLAEELPTFPFVCSFTTVHPPAVTLDSALSLEYTSPLWGWGSSHPAQLALGSKQI